MKKSLAVILSLVLFCSTVFASSVSQKKPFPYEEGITLTKNVLYLNARELSAGAGLNTLWSDTFKDASQINSGSSSGYTARGASNYDVILDTNPPVIITSMTTNSAPSPFVASGNSDSSNAFKCFDGSTGTYWNPSTNVLPQYVTLDMGSAKTVVKYKLKSSGTNTPRDWTIKASATGSFAGEETTLDTRSSENPTTLTEYTISSPQSFRYYRITVSAVNGASNAKIETLEYYESAATTAVVRSVATTFSSSVSEVMVFADFTLNSGSISLIRVSADNGSNWKDVTNNLEEIVSLGHSGTQIILEVTFTGNSELEFWGVSA